MVEALPRYVMRACPQPLPYRGLTSLTGLVLITADQLAIAPELAAALQQLGANPVVLPLATLLDFDQLEPTINQLRQTHGPVTGIVHLAALAPIPLPADLAAWRESTQIQVKSLFRLLQLSAADLQQVPRGRVLAASLLGGYLGRQGDGGPGLPTGGCHCGIMKTLIAEWPSVIAKAVDLDARLAPNVLAQQLLQEFLVDGGRVEVGYPQGERTIFQSVATPLVPTATPQLMPASDWVVLVTGGARGITAEIVHELLLPGMQLILVGSSAEPGPESAATAGMTEISALRQTLLKQAQAQGLALTPVQMERQIQGLLRDRTIRSNLEQFRQQGAKVEYVATDVRDPAAFGGLIEQLYQRYGRLDAVIHGAGIIDDKLITDKSLASFERVFDTKVDSTFILSRHLKPETLKLLVLFTSVAGRYGNRGQVDYAAANEVLNRMAWSFDHQWPQTRVLAINWGPWDTPGMASAEVKRQLLERQILPIPGPAGCRFFLDELLYGRKGETEVVAGEGPWEATEAEQNQFGSEVIAAAPASSSGRLPLMVDPPQLQPNSSVILHHTFSLATDPYLKDHCLDGKPVLPAAGALEWMAEFVQVAWPEWRVTQARDLRVLRGVVLTDDTPLEVQFRARASSHADAESLHVAAEILDANTNVPLYRATLILHLQPSSAPDLEIYPLSPGAALDPAMAYRNYLFHGPLFQQIQAIAAVNPQGIDAQVVPSPVSDWQPLALRPQEWGSWIFDPGLVDTAPQLAIVWARIHQETTALPSRFGEVTRYGDTEVQGPLQLLFRVKQSDAHTLIYDAAFVDRRGHLRLLLKDVESTCNQSLNRLAGQA